MSAPSLQIAYEELVSDHLTLRRYGYRQHPVISFKMVNGHPMYFRTWLNEDGQLRVGEANSLPGHLAAPITLLEQCRDGWIDKLMIESGRRRRANILRAIYVIDRLIARLVRRAIKCRGTRFLKIGVAQEIVGAAQRVANASFEVDGTSEEAAFEEAWTRIASRLQAASCPLAA